MNFDIVDVLGVFTETCLTRKTGRVQLVEQELLTLLENMYWLSVFSGICVARSLVFCVVFCRSLFCPFILVGHCIVCPSTGGFSLSVWLLQTFLDNRIKYIFRFIIPKYRFSYQKDMLINNLFTSELCNELFTSPVLFTRCTIYVRIIFNYLDSWREHGKGHSIFSEFSLC